jgi:hypothetical protein
MSGAERDQVDRCIDAQACLLAGLEKRHAHTFEQWMNAGERIIELEKQIEKLEEELRKAKFLKWESAEAWIWCGDDNDLESMARDMVVVITAGDLRKLLEKP